MSYRISVHPPLPNKEQQEFNSYTKAVAKCLSLVERKWDIIILRQIKMIKGRNYCFREWRF